MAGWWFLQNSASLSALPEEWLSPQLSLLDVALLAVLTLCWREIAGSAMASGSNLVRKQAIGNLIAALCCSILAFIAGCTHTTPTQAMILSVCFFLASSSISLLWLAGACVSRWVLLTYIVTKHEVILVGSGPRRRTFLQS